MKIYHGLETVDPPLSRVTLTIGNFDGVHRGHQQILAQTCMSASQANSITVVMTFDPHPLAVIDPDRAVPPLMPLQERLDLIAACGIRAAVVARTDPQLLALSPQHFVKHILMPRFRPAAVVQGQSWRFGRNQSGDVNTLRALGQHCGFEVSVVPNLTIQLHPGSSVLVSSSLIRDLVRQHHVDQAAACLGRPYAIFGHVVPGRQIGRGLGFPTANIEVTNQILPADGIYAGRAHLSGDAPASLTAAVSIGPAPTFNRQQSLVEAHLMDFDAQLYGQPIRLELLRWIRPQHAFPNPDKLRRQIERDVRHIRAIIKTTP
jgi:riboflavin kinase/FMN adenylyltransferase